MNSFDLDTWFNWQQPAVPLMLGATFEACGAPFRDFFGFPFFTSVLYYRLEDGLSQASWLLRIDEGKACGRTLTELLAVPSARRHFEASYAAAVARLEALTDEAGELGREADGGHRDQLRSYGEAFVDFYKLGAVTEPIQWWAEEIARTISGNAQERSATREWSEDRVAGALFALSEDPYTTVIDEDLAALARVVESTSDWAQGDYRIASTEAADATQLHLERYGWRANNYGGVKIITASDVMIELAAVARAESDRASTVLARRVARARAHREQALADRAEVLRDVRPAFANAIVLGDECGSTLADRRKATMLRALSGMHSLAERVANEIGLDFGDALWLNPRELADETADAALLAGQARLRRAGFVQVLSPSPLADGEMEASLSLAPAVPPYQVAMPQLVEPTYAEGDDAGAALEQVDLALGLFDTASAGRVVSGELIIRPLGNKLQGRCMIVRDPHDTAASEFRDGDVLVATSTTPDFMPVIRKAAAIVADQAGATSHAAVVSREMNLPCVVGTRIGSAVLEHKRELVITAEEGSTTAVVTHEL